MTEFKFNDAALANLKGKVAIVTGTRPLNPSLTLRGLEWNREGNSRIL